MKRKQKQHPKLNRSHFARDEMSEVIELCNGYYLIYLEHTIWSKLCVVSMIFLLILSQCTVE